MRNYSDRLSSSFRGSAGYGASVTIGLARERQVVDFLRLLPARLTIEKDLVVVDHEGTNAPQFDGFILDRSNLPLLYAEGLPGDLGIVAAMIESVIACVETKSRVNESELNDIFTKARRLNSLKVLGLTRPPILASFAYECSNLSLAFFDYSVRFLLGQDGAPTPICVLNQGILGAARIFGNELRLVDRSSADAVPVLVETKQDSLLAFFYLLFRASSTEPPWDTVAEAYSAAFLSSMECFTFDRDFLEAISEPQTANLARGAFQRRPTRPVDDLYGDARARVGLN